MAIVGRIATVIVAVAAAGAAVVGFKAWPDLARYRKLRKM